MSFKKGADGVTKQGKTKGKNLGDSGPTAKVQAGGKKTAGVTGKAMWFLKVRLNANLWIL